MFYVYGNTTCSYCTKAKILLHQYGRQFAFLNTDDYEHLNDLKTRLPDVKTIPQIWWNDEHIGGYNELVEYIENTHGGYGDGKL